MEAKYIRYLVALLSVLFQCANVLAGADDWREELIFEGVKKLDALIAQNKANEEAGRSHLNSYIVNLDGGWSQKGDFIEERGEGPNDKFTLLNSDELALLDNDLKSFHARYSPKKEVGVYVIMVNNFQLLIRNQLPGNPEVQKLSDFAYYIDKDKQDQIKDLTKQMKGIVREVIDRTKNKGYTKQTYGILYGVISTYDLDSPDLTTGIVQDQLEPVSYLSVFMDKSAATSMESYRVINSEMPKGKDLVRSHAAVYPRLEALIKGFEKGYLKSRAIASLEEEAVALGIKEGPGRTLFMNLPKEKTLANEQKAAFGELCKYLNTETSGKTFAFYHPGLPNEIGQNGKDLYEQTQEYIYEKDLLTKEKFSAHFFKNQCRDVDMIFANVDLWEGIPEDYNEYSIDWTGFNVPEVLTYEELFVYLEIIEQTLEYYKTNQPGHIKPETESAIQELLGMFRYTENLLETQKEFVPRAIRYMLVDLGFYPKYHYAFADLKKREELKGLEGQFFSVVRKSEEEHKNAGPIAQYLYHEQYAAQYGTASAFYLGEKYMTMMGLIYSLHALGVGTNMATNSLKAIPAYNQRMRMYNSRAKLVATQVKARMSETFLARYPAVRAALTASRSEVGSNAKMYELDNFIRRLGKTELTKLEGNPALVSKLAQNHAKDPKLLVTFKTVKGSYEEWVVKAEGEIAGSYARFLANKENYVAAIARGENVFYVGKHTDIKPRPTGPKGIAESHHGVNSVWMKAKYSDYSAENAPTVYMLKEPNHNATRGEFNRWAAEMRQRQGLTKVDYTKVSKEDIINLANRQFDVADVPQIVRAEYFKNWENYLKTLKSK